METFLESIYNRLTVIGETTKVNEFSGKNINSIKSIILQITQNNLLSDNNKKLICLDILSAVEELNK